jgi:hypothetical protein
MELERLMTKNIRIPPPKNIDEQTPEDIIKGVKEIKNIPDLKPQSWIKNVKSDIYLQVIKHYREQFSKLSAAKKEKTKHKYSDAYKSICVLREKLAAEGKPPPDWKTCANWIFFIADIKGNKPYKGKSKKKGPYGKRTIEKIIRLGDAGLL